MKFTPYIAAVALAGVAGVGFAQQNCGDTAKIRENLSSKYNEELQASGLSSRGYMIEFWGNSANETWTVIATSSNGQSCVIDHGEHFERAELKGQL